MTATTKTYLQRLPVAFGVLVLTYILSYVFLTFIKTEPSNIQVPAFLTFFLNGAGLLLALGIIFDSFTHCKAAIIVHAAITVFHFLLAAAIGRSAVPPPGQVAIAIYNNIELLPYIFFVSKYTHHWKAQRIWLIIAVLVLYRGLIVSNSGYAFQGFSLVDDAFWYTTIIKAVLKIASWTSFVLLITVLINYAAVNEKPVLNKFKLETNTHHGADTIAFFSLKSLLSFSPGLLAALMANTPSSQIDSQHDWALFLLRVNWLLSVLSCIAALIAGVLLLRVQILAFVLRFKISLRAGFWLLTIPLIGFIAWLLIGSMNKPQTEKQQQLNALRTFRKDSFLPLVACVVIGYILAGIWLSKFQLDDDVNYILTASAVLFILSLLNMPAFRAQLSIQVVVLAYFIIMRILDEQNLYTTYFLSENSEASDYFKYMLVLQLATIGVAWSILLLPALHPDHFRTDDEKVSTENDHLFAEHELQ